MVQWVDIKSAQEFDAFVKAHENCHFMQTSAWGRVKNDWLWQGAICRASDGKILGTMGILSRKMKWCNGSILYAPRGPVCDRSQTKVIKELLDAAKELAKKVNAIYFRIDPMVKETDDAFLDFMKSQGFLRNQASDFSLFQPRLCYVMQLEEGFERRYHSGTKRHLRQAVKQGIRVCESRDVETFSDLMNKTARHNGFEARDRDYFRRFLEQMGKSAKLYLAYENGFAVAGSIAVFLGNRAWYMYGASDPENRRSHPNELLQWQMQRDAIDRNCQYFDMRGVEGYPIAENPKIGLHQFKQGFGAEFVAYMGQFDYVCRSLPYRLLNWYAKAAL